MKVKVRWVRFEKGMKVAFVDHHAFMKRESSLAFP